MHGKCATVANMYLNINLILLSKSILNVHSSYRKCGNFFKICVALRAFLILIFYYKRTCSGGQLIGLVPLIVDHLTIITELTVLLDNIKSCKIAYYAELLKMAVHLHIQAKVTNFRINNDIIQNVQKLASI